MNLVEVIAFYRKTLKSEGREAADKLLVNLGVHKVIQKAIVGSFKDKP